MTYTNRSPKRAPRFRTFERSPEDARSMPAPALLSNPMPRAAINAQSQKFISADEQSWPQRTTHPINGVSQVHGYGFLSNALPEPANIVASGVSTARRSAGPVAYHPHSPSTTTKGPSRLLTEALAPTPMLQTHNDIGPANAELIPGDWSGHAFAPHALDTQALPDFELNTALTTQTSGEASAEQLNSWRWFTPLEIEMQPPTHIDVSASLTFFSSDNTPVLAPRSGMYARFELAGEAQGVTSSTSSVPNRDQMPNPYLTQDRTALARSAAQQQLYQKMLLRDRYEGLTALAWMDSGADLSYLAAATPQTARAASAQSAYSVSAASRAGKAVLTGVPRTGQKKWDAPLACVDPQTGKAVPLGTPGALQKKSETPHRACVAPQTGEMVPPGTPGAISKTTFHARKLVDPQTGKLAPPGTPNAISRRAFHARKLVDPQTGKLAPPGTPGAITRNKFFSRLLVDPQTGDIVPEDTPGAVTRHNFYYHSFIDPQTGEAVPAGTPGAVTRKEAQYRMLAEH